jgi:penicillin-binding protein 1A
MLKRLFTTLLVLIGLALLGVAGIVGVFFYISIDLPQINSLKDYNPPMNSRILSRDNVLLLEIGTETREVVPFDKIPSRVVDAFLAAEDDNFFKHEGIDYYGILRAFIVNLREGRLVQGGSTITQQVAKSFLLTKERTISRKIKDLLLARKIEQKFSKEEILYLYLNQVYLGGGYYGVKAAFRGYFDKTLEEATPAESALVAGLLVAPGRYSPYVNPKYAKVRQKYVLRRMYETNKITEQEYNAALEENIKMRIRLPNELKGGHFTDWVRQEAMKAVGTDEFLTNGFTVITTLDWSLQKKAEKIVKDRVKELDKRQGFKGPIRNLKDDLEIKAFISEQRKKLMREESTYFIFSTQGEKKYEYHEEDEAFDKILSAIDLKSKDLPPRLKSLVEVGNPGSDFFDKFIKEGQSYLGVVLAADDLKRTVLASVAGARVIIPESGFDWAHQRKITDSPVYFNQPKSPSKIIKPGDVILISIKRKIAPLDQLINGDFFKKHKDVALKSLLSKQNFIHGELDQDPDVEGSLIAINSNNGEVLSMVGGVDFQKSQFNRVIQSRRQPGSAFKPFIFAAALESGYSPSSILMDTPQALGGADNTLSWKPRNYDGDFKGPMTLRNALEVSRNIPTVRLVQNLGVQKIQDFVDRIHMNTELPKDMSLSLGSFGISLAELTKAYAIFPNGGRAIRLQHITSIKDRNGKSYSIPAADSPWNTNPNIQAAPKTEGAQVDSENVSSESNPFLENLNATQVLDPRVAYLMTNLLRGVTLYGTAAAASTLGNNIGGKTGTTNSYVDALFVGFSANVVVGAWTGFDDNRPLGYGETGGKSALPIWIDYMSVAATKYGMPDFIAPPGVVFMPINKETGKSLAPGGQGFVESFVEGFDPNSATSKSFPDQFSQGGPGVDPSMIDDDDYFMNQ